MTTQYVDEGGAEFPVEDRVDDGIERRVAITEPEYYGEQAVWNVEVEEHRQRVDGEERKPASDERRHDDAEHQSGAAFADPRQPALGALLLVDDHRTPRLCRQLTWNLDVPRFTR